MTNNEILLDKVLEYQRTKDRKLREEIILDNLDFADKLSKNYSEKYLVNFDELKSYGYEGLILGIDTYTEDSKYDIHQHIFYNIGNKLIRGVGELKGFNLGELPRYFEVRKEVEEEYGMPLEDIKGDLDELVNDIIDKINSRYKDNEKATALSLKVIKDILGDLSIDDKKSRYKLNQENYLMDLTNYDNILILKEIREELIKASHQGMNEFEQATLISYFGLDDGVLKTLKDIGNMFNVSACRAGQVQEKALRNMKHPFRAWELRHCADFVADHDYYRR